MSIIQEGNRLEQEYQISDISDVFRPEFMKWLQYPPSIFRGQADFNWGTVPSLYRDVVGREFDLENRQLIEDILLQRFFARAEPYLNSPKRSFLRDRILAQHYGVPTRLLDWTQNPLVALYFAVENDARECDGALICGRTTATWTGAVDSYGPSQALEPEFVSLIPPHLDSRIVAQTAILTIQNQLNSQKRFLPLEDYRFAREGDSVRKFLIPADSKPRIYRDLLNMGITHWSIYPSLQGVGDGVKREFERVWGYIQF